MFSSAFLHKATFPTRPYNWSMISFRGNIEFSLSATKLWLYIFTGYNKFYFNFSFNTGIYLLQIFLILMKSCLNIRLSLKIFWIPAINYNCFISWPFVFDAFCFLMVWLDYINNTLLLLKKDNASSKLTK